MNVLLLGHSCHPYWGSEPSMVWSWASHLAKLHRVCLLAHPRFKQKINETLARNPIPNLTIAWVSVSHHLDPWNPDAGDAGVQLHYLLWQNEALRVAKRLHSEQPFDIAHHVGWSTVSAPSPLHRLKIPFAWGPIGGGQVWPPSLYLYCGYSWPAEILRSLRVKLMAGTPALRRAVRNANLLVCTNHETARVLASAGAERIEFCPDSGVRIENLCPEPSHPRPPTPLHVIWAGRLIRRKALLLGLEALAAVPDHIPVHLTVAGGGPLREECERWVGQRRLSGRIRFLGEVPWPEMPNLFRSGNLFLFTSLRDSFGGVVLEAMAQALPVLTLDHQGVGTFLPPEAAIKVTVGSRSDVVSGLRDSMVRFASDSEMQTRMSRAAWKYASQQTWTSRAAQMTSWYEQIVTGQIRTALMQTSGTQ